MNKLMVGTFIFGTLLLLFGLFAALTSRDGGAILVSASILIASVFICLKIEELKKK